LNKIFIDTVDDADVQMCEAIYKNNKKSIIIPLGEDTVQSLNVKRNRKVKFDSFAENNFYHYPLGLNYLSLRLDMRR